MCDKDVCERWYVTKMSVKMLCDKVHAKVAGRSWCVKDGVWKRVCDKDVCERWFDKDVCKDGV